jgi:hypothetical protein
VTEGAFPSKAFAWARQVTNAHAARKFMEACEGADIPVLPVKGAVSAATLYDDPADRPLTDVDVRVRRSDLGGLERLCRARGWPIVQSMKSYGNVITLVDDVYVDVEAHVGPPGMCNLHVSSMLDRARWSDALGFRCRVPDFTDHAVLLVVNAFKDKLAGAFEWSVRDLERLPRAREFDLAGLTQRLRESAASTLGWITADWMVRVRGAEPWADVRDALGPPRRDRYVRAFAWSMRRSASGLTSRVLGRIASDSPRERIRALAWMGIWQAEVALSQLGRAPYRRGFVPPSVRAGRERS